MTQISVQLFGGFRPLGSQMDLQLAPGATIADVRAAFAAQLPADLHGLLKVSRFADERAVLAEDAQIKQDVTLAILPPVSGG